MRFLVFCLVGFAFVSYARQSKQASSALAYRKRSEVKGIKPYNLKTLPAKRPYNLTLVNEIRVVTNPLLVLMVLK